MSENFYAFLERRRELLTELFEILQGCDWAIAGGVAVSFYVKEREPTSHEFDILVDSEDFNRVYQRMLDLNWHVVPSGFSSWLEFWRGEKEGFIVDIMLCQLDAWENFEYHRVKWRKLIVNVLKPKGLIELKTIAGRDKDWEDLERLNKLLKEV